MRFASSRSFPSTSTRLSLTCSAVLTRLKARTGRIKQPIAVTACMSSSCMVLSWRTLQTTWSKRDHLLARSERSLDTFVDISDASEIIYHLCLACKIPACHRANDIIVSHFCAAVGFGIHCSSESSAVMNCFEPLEWTVWTDTL